MTQVLVVDGSDSHSRLPSDAPEVQLANATVIQAIPGLAHQRNVALGHLAPNIDIVHFLDDDISLESEYFAVIQEQFGLNPEASGVGVRVHDLPEDAPHPALTLFMLDSRKSGVVLPSGVNVAHRARGTYRVQWLQGCSMSYRVSAIEGLRFDERRRGVSMGEDVDFSMKAGTRGQLWITDATKLQHHQTPVARDHAAERRYEYEIHRFLLSQSFPLQIRRVAITWSLVGTRILVSAASVLDNASRVDFRRRGHCKNAFEALKYISAAAIGVLKLPIAGFKGLLDSRQLRARSMQRNAPRIKDENPIPLAWGNGHGQLAVQLEGDLRSQLEAYIVGLSIARSKGLRLLLDTSLCASDGPDRYHLGLLEGPDVESVPRAIATKRVQVRGKTRSEIIRESRTGTCIVGPFADVDLKEFADTHAKDRILAAFNLQHRQSESVEISIVLWPSGIVNARNPWSISEIRWQEVESCLAKIRQRVGNLPARVYCTSTESVGVERTPPSDALIWDAEAFPTLAQLSKISRSRAVITTESQLGWWFSWLADPQTPVVMA